MWDVDGSDGMSFRDPRTQGAVATGQQTLWEGAGLAQPELLELASQRIAQGPVSLEGLGHWLLLETARWRRQDARRAVQQLQNEWSIVVEKHGGRLSRTSVIRPR
jgi:hypothetical protein